MLKALEQVPFVYLFVERKSEKDLCETFQQEINEKLGNVVLGVPNRFEQIFEALMQVAKTRQINVVIDELHQRCDAEDDGEGEFALSR